MGVLLVSGLLKSFGNSIGLAVFFAVRVLAQGTF